MNRGLSWGDLMLFEAQCDSLDVEVPQPIRRGLELIDIAQEAATDPRPSMLAMSDDEARAFVVDASIRRHSGDADRTRGMSSGSDELELRLGREIRAAMLPHLDEIVEALQPRFDEAAEPLVTAARDFGFTYDTTPEDVILLADEDASAAYRGVRESWHVLDPYVEMRSTISTLFEVSPTDRELRTFTTPVGPLDESVCFAAGDNWATDGAYYVERTIPGGQLDWLALAAVGLRLNTPTEVAAKIKRRRSLRLAPAE